MLLKIVVAIALACAARSALADDFRWTGAGGSNVWSNPANWLNLTTGQPGAFPGPADDVVFDASAAATAGAARNLTNSGTLRVGTGVLAIHGTTILNNGVLTFLGNGMNNSGAIDDVYEIVGDTTLTGPGVLLLAEPAESALLGAGTLTNDFFHTIRGRGVIGVNLTNRSVLLAENGRLSFTANVNNAKGTVAAHNDGELFLGTGATISGGVLEAWTPTTISGPAGAGGLLENLRTAGTFRAATTALGLAGTITNNGTLTFLADGVNNFGGVDDAYAVAGTATLAGMGELVLVEPGESGLLGGGVLTNAADHTIRGRGIIGVSVINQGAIRAENGRLSLTAHVNNAGGTIASDDGGELFLGTDVAISGGAVDATSPMTVAGPAGAGGRLENLATTGTIRVATTALSLNGTITNNGTLTFLANGVNNFGGVDDAYAVAGAATLAGTGELVLVEPGESGLLGGGVLTNGADHTIRGQGSVGVELVNQGLLRAEGGKLTVGNRVAGDGRVEIAAGATLEFNGPSLSAGTIELASGGVLDFNGERLEFATFAGNLVHDRGTLAPGQGASLAVVSGNLQMSGSAALDLQIGGVAPGTFDALQVAGAASVDGALRVHAVSDLGPLGTSAELALLTAASLGGAFDDAPLVGNHLGFGVFLTAYEFDAAGARIAVAIEQQLHPGDFDADGDVDVADLGRWRAGFGQMAAATLEGGDADGDRDVDGDDFLIWQRHMSAASAAGHAALRAPEPTGAMVLPAAIVALAAGRRPKAKSSRDRGRACPRQSRTLRTPSPVQRPRRHTGQSGVMDGRTGISRTPLGPSRP